MSQGIEDIGKRDIAWSYAATFFTIGAGVLLLPFILNKLSAETVGIWNIFQTITAFVLLLDFGFRPSFARNVSYILSGVKQLQKVGVNHVTAESSDIDYSLLKGTLHVMQRFYRWMALTVFVLLASVGTAYLCFILKKYSGNTTDALIAWVILIVINCYNLYTYYYDALLTGKGYVKRIQQITILGQSIYILTAIALIYAGFGLIAIVSAQLLSTVIRRVLAHRVFFDKKMKQALADAVPIEEKGIMSAIYPNALKVGLTYLGGFLVNRSAVLMGAAFLPLAVVASYGITVQIIDIIVRCGTVIYQSYTPKLAQYRAEQNYEQLRRLYKYSVLSLLTIIIAGGIVLIFGGKWALTFIKSDTTLLPTAMLCAMLVISLLENNHSIAAGFIMADNKIPFFIPSLVSGLATIVIMWIMLYVFDMGIWAMILAPGIAQVAYQNWKWPYTIIKELYSTHSQGNTK